MPNLLTGIKFALWGTPDESIQELGSVFSLTHNLDCFFVLNISRFLESLIEQNGGVLVDKVAHDVHYLLSSHRMSAVIDNEYKLQVSFLSFNDFSNKHFLFLQQS
jgi:hypothetical protein